MSRSAVARRSGQRRPPLKNDILKKDWKIREQDMGYEKRDKRHDYLGAPSPLADV